MKKLLLIFTLLFSTLMFSTPSYGEWKLLGKSPDGDSFYVDFERIRKHDGHVYSWDLSDYLKPTKQGYLSAKNYKQIDCKLFRYKDLSWYFHEQPMGMGKGQVVNPPVEGWIYPPPNSVSEGILEDVCNH